VRPIRFERIDLHDYRVLRDAAIFNSGKLEVGSPPMR